MAAYADHNKADVSAGTKYANIMKNPFDAPPEGAIPATDRALSVEYKNTKGITHDFAPDITPAWIKEKFGEGRFGFAYYDKDAQKLVSLPEFTFVVLDVYAGISGYNPDTKESFWSNRAKDTRTDALSVSSNHGLALKGLYQDIKKNLPKGAKYTKFVKAYCLQLDRVIELKLSAMVEAAMQKAIAETESSEAKRKSWENIFLLSIADGDLLWGFHLSGHGTVDIKGNDYTGTGDLFFTPKFQAGIVNPVKRPDLHAKCVALQNAERAAHQSYAQKAEPKVEPFVIIETAPAVESGFPDAAPEPVDDLPF